MAKPSSGTARFGWRGLGITLNRAYVGTVPSREGMVGGLRRQAAEMIDDLHSLLGQMVPIARDHGIPISIETTAEADDADVGCSPGGLYVSVDARWQKDGDERSGFSFSADETALLNGIATDLLKANGYKISYR